VLNVGDAVLAVGGVVEPDEGAALPVTLALPLTVGREVVLNVGAAVPVTPAEGAVVEPDEGAALPALGVVDDEGAELKPSVGKAVG
jgi:hypothetical protein